MNQIESKNKTTIPSSETTWDTFYPIVIPVKQKAKLKKIIPNCIQRFVTAFTLDSTSNHISLLMNLISMSAKLLK